MSRRDRLLVVALLAFIVLVLGLAVFVVADNIDKGNDVQDTSSAVTLSAGGAA